ncbi:hypothetical protein ONE63_007733 [Megalurothrips usitatus]|uniref:MH1 domain-containing protein n=1 Tax=Megalurothrips usitatus TaxID=439358 RepID=A0AAV7XPP0_9NEOP|nr:hypothetical protein ONE63_007733 [Megalurothrips usitatus]
MFRNRRNTLAKRLWNARVLQREHGAAAGAAGAVGTAGAGPNPAAPGPPSQQAALRNTFLKRLKDPQLETLLQAVESRGASLTSCVVLDRDPDQQHQPHLLCCQIWRWPELQQGSELRPLPMCSVASGGSGVGNSVCCNPYHWSRLCKPEELGPGRAVSAVSAALSAASPARWAPHLTASP